MFWVLFLLYVYSTTINELELGKRCYILFRRQLPLFHSISEHPFDPNDKHFNPFFHWKTLQVSFLDQFIRSLFNENVEKGQKRQI